MAQIVKIVIVIACKNFLSGYLKDAEKMNSNATGVVLIEPMELYNLLNQEAVYPSLSDSAFLLLLGNIC